MSYDEEEKGFVSLSDVSQVVWNDIEERACSEDFLLGVDTGFRDLNYFTLGFQKSDLIILAARPGMGKTSFCLNIAESVACQEGQAVAYLSLETSKERLFQRLIASHSEIDSQKVRTGKSLTEQNWDDINMALGELSNNTSIYFDDTPFLFLENIVERIISIVRNNEDIKLVIIDYLQLIQSKEYCSDIEKITRVSRRLKTLARELDIVIIAVSQLSRALETRQNRRPVLNDLRDSGALEEDADLVIFLYRHEYYEPYDIEERGVCEIIIAKQRNGPVATVKLRFHSATTRFYNLEQGY